MIRTIVLTARPPFNRHGSLSDNYNAITNIALARYMWVVPGLSDTAASVQVEREARLVGPCAKHEVAMHIRAREAAFKREVWLAIRAQ